MPIAGPSSQSVVAPISTRQRKREMDEVCRSSIAKRGAMRSDWEAKVVQGFIIA
jgi:hypothetical protein